MHGPDVDYLADHTLLLALPAFAPAVVVAAVVVYVAMRDRRRGNDTPQGEDPDSSGHDESP
jgi:hypothetical protein